MGFCGVLGVVSTAAPGGVLAEGRVVGAGVTAGLPLSRTLLGGIGVASGGGAGGSGAFC